MSEEKVLVTRFCRSGLDLRSAHNPNFPWPREGPVSCPDWDPTPRCGGGLHGWLWGKGDPDAWMFHPSHAMLVVEVLKDDIVSLDNGDKVKFPKGTVVHCGSRESVTQFMADRGHVGITYGQMTVGDGETATVGDRGTAIAGNGGTAKAGYGGSALVGQGGTAKVGVCGIASAGDGGRVEVQDRGTAVVGIGGVVTVLGPEIDHPVQVTFTLRHGGMCRQGIRQRGTYALDEGDRLVTLSGSW